MTLRGPAAPLRKAQSWRRSGDESFWESLISEPPIPRPPRGARPQSAVEGGQLDGWLEQLRRIQREPPVHDQVAPFNDYTSSLPNLDKESPGRPWKQKGAILSSRGSSSGGSPSLCDSSLSSQESLQTGLLSPPERRESWERAHISQAPKKEQTRVSFLTPVKIGWLPIRRKARMLEEQVRNTDSAGQVKLKEPITPTLPKNAPTSVKSRPDEEVGRSHSGLSSSGVRTYQPPEVPGKRITAVSEGAKPVSWQALKRGWKLNRVFALPGGSVSNKGPTGTSTDPQRTKPLPQTTNVEPDEHNLLQRTTSADPFRAQLQGTDSTSTYKAPLHRTSSVQPIKASHIATTSTAATLIPENKDGFSSITISSRKVSRSASLPSSGRLPTEPMDTNPRRVMVQRKATIVKVTEHRVTTSPVHSMNQPTSHTVDTVVHQRKATIIKVTEHRESYTPANVNSGRKSPEYRHSYSEGLYKEKSTWTQGNHTEHNNVISTQNTSAVPKDPQTVHRSTLNLIMTTPPAIAATPAPSEESSLRAVGAKSNRPQRPLSCYGALFGNSEAREENVLQPVARKWSLGSSQGISPGNPDSSLNTTGTDAAQPNKSEGSPKMTPPSLMLIKTPDAHQTPEDILALNAAAIIANIKLQRQLSKKKTPKGKCEKDSAPPPEGKTVIDVKECMKPDNSPVHVHSQQHAAFVPLSHGLQRSTENVSLQECLQRSRPDFISRSQHRLQELERRAQERSDLAHSADSKGHSNHGTATRDNLFKPRDRAIRTKELPLRSKRPAEGKRKKEEEARRELCLNNRHRAELFKKKLLDQVLQRSND